MFGPPFRPLQAILTTRFDQIELRVPRGRGGVFSIELFEHYERSEKRASGFAASNDSALMQMYLHGVSAREAGKVTGVFHDLGKHLLQPSKNRIQATSESVKRTPPKNMKRSRGDVRQCIPMDHLLFISCSIAAMRTQRLSNRAKVAWFGFSELEAA